MGPPLPRASRLVIVLVLSLTACQESRVFPFDASLSDIDVLDGVDADGDAPDVDSDSDVSDADAGDLETDAEDVGPDTDDDEIGDTSAPPVVESCGDGEMLFLGEPANVGDPCGCGGVLACNGARALRCVGDRPVDACGGCRQDSRLPGDACGPCNDGVMACDGIELVCDGAGPGNLCGGCLPLEAAPNDRCTVEDELGIWACESPNSLRCVDPRERNACGWEGPLVWEGSDAWPGRECESACGGGRLVCDALERAVRCAGPTPNACGGCAPLDVPVGERCGCGGAWRCNGPNEVMCDGGASNACGGCEPLDLLPGEPCGGEVAVCVGPDTVECRGRDGWNACGGTATLSLVPGVACGACASGVVECTGRDEVQCIGDRGLDAFNPCGGCEPLPLADLDACGVCSAGTPVCLSGDEFVCESVDESPVPNSCGGCSALDAAIGDSCGTCARWACAGGVAECRFSNDDAGCDEFPVRCDELDCEGQLRACEESGADASARCAECLPGHVEVEGECTPVECTVDADCAPEVSEWGTCTYTSTCDEVADRTREVVEFGCDAGFCTEASRTTERVECANRDTDGLSCGAAHTCLDGTCGGFPGPLSVTATQDRPGDVVLTWSASDGATGYEVRIDSGTWAPVGPEEAAARRLTDPLAPPPTVAACTIGVDASDGTFEEYVALTCAGSSATSGGTRLYEIRGVNAYGAGLEAMTVGRRAPGTIGHTWQRALDVSGPFSTLSALTTPNAFDLTAPTNGAPRWYRAAVWADGAATAYSPAVRGSRRAQPEVLGRRCEVDAGCGEGECFNGRCVPPGYVYVPAGSSDFGSPPEETGRRSGGTCLRLPCSEEDPGVAVITRPFFMARNELTNAEWQSLFGTSSPSTFSTCGANCPVETINWYEAIAVANRASQQEGLPMCYTLSGCTSASGIGGGCGDSGRCTGTYTCDTVTFVGFDCEGYRLPTEAEWEHAYRAGSSTSLHNGNLTVPDSSLDPHAGLIAWYLPNASTRTHAGGGKTPNTWGLHDMSGNVWEWTWDRYAFARAPKSADPLGSGSGASRVHRGGFWESPGADIRAATRGSRDPAERNMDIGLRLVRTVAAPLCADMACSQANRACSDTDELQYCGACLPGANEVNGQCGMPLPAPSTVTTAGNAESVSVSWSAVEGATGYEVSVDGGPWISAGLSLSYVHGAAGLATITPCGIVGTAVTGGLRVSCPDPVINPAPAHDYRVRTLNGALPGNASTSASGSRTVGALGYQWSYSDNGGGAFSTATGATTASWTDTAYVSTSWTRIYRVRIAAGGAESVYSEEYVHP